MNDAALRLTEGENIGQDERAGGMKNRKMDLSKRHTRGTEEKYEEIDDR